MIVVALGLLAGPAAAAPVRGSGKATASETKKPSITRARSRALRRARRAALQSALGSVGGSVDPKARKAVLGAAEAWTGAYRIISESNDGDAVQIEVEADIDLVRLTKRVQRADKSAGKPAFVLGRIDVAPECGAAESVTEAVHSELVGQGAAVLEGKGAVLDLSLECNALGPVHHTYLHAAQVTVAATVEGQAITQLRAPAFATSPLEAMAAGVDTALIDLGESLATRRRGHVRVRVRSPLPSARVRRLEVAMRNSVLGVSGVEVTGIERGVVELRVRSSLTAKTLAKRLTALRLPGFSLSVVDVEPPDALTIALE